MLMSSQSQRGAVSIVVVIIVGIVALGFGALWFTTLQESTKAKEAYAEAQSKVLPTEARLHFAESGYGELAKVIGPKVPADLPKPENWARNDFGQASNSAFVQDPLLLGQKLDGIKAWMKTALEEVGEKDRAPANIQETVEAMGNAYKRLQNDIKKAQDEVVKAKDAEIESLQKKLADAEKKGSEDLAALTTEKENATARLNQQLTEANSQRDEAQAANRKLTEDITSTKDTANKEVNTAKAKQRMLDAQVSALHSSDKIQRETDKADGKILAVNRALKTAWIDVGGRDRVRRGASFKVFEAIKAGQKIPKGRVVVTTVENDRSEVAIEREEGNGIAEGDIIVSPVFDKNKATKFVILGELNGRLNKEAAKRVLEGLGAKVEDKVTVDTDFVVLGVKEAPDAPELTDSEAYKQAQAWGIEIIRARDLDPFLTF
jgi:NAD-dependent DNA ligase